MPGVPYFTQSPSILPVDLPGKLPYSCPDHRKYLPSGSVDLLQLPYMLQGIPLVSSPHGCLTQKQSCEQDKYSGGAPPALIAWVGTDLDSFQRLVDGLTKSHLSSI